MFLYFGIGNDYFCKDYPSYMIVFEIKIHDNPLYSITNLILRTNFDFFEETL